MTITFARAGPAPFEYLGALGGPSRVATPSGRG
jgi:hypothetical protein